MPAKAKSVDDRVRELNDKAVRQLVEAHQERTDEPLVLAVRYRLDDPEDIYLFEALDGFPGGDEDELLETEFEPSANLRLLGKLHLVLGSPAQTRHAIAARGDAIMAAIRDGQVEFDDGSFKAAKLRKALGL